jgi:opacity protein-like surface antigen
MASRLQRGVAQERISMKSGMKHGLRVVMVLAFVTVMAKPASADWLFTPYLGIVFGGAANTVDIDTLDEAFEQRAVFGGSLATMGSGVFGLEFDFSYAPNFFQLTEGGEDFEFFDVNSSITTLMGNVIIGIPIGGTSGAGVRPYATAGVGVMRANVNFGDILEDLSSNDLGVNFGGGVQVFFSDTLGLRGDLRYFRGVSTGDDDAAADIDFNLNDFDFWRGTVGITFRFGG